MTETPADHAFVQQVSNQLLLARALGVVAELGIADLVACQPRTVDELAAETNTHRESLYRLLRTLAGHGIFAENAAGHIELTPRAEVLQSDHPDSVRDLLCLDWQNIYWDTCRALPDALRSGDIAFELAFGQGFFDYLKAHPDANAIFDRRMARVSLAENAKIAEAYPFGDFSRIIDIGGGTGGLLVAILERYPNVAAVLYEQAQVLADPADLRQAGLLNRVELIAGDFFTEVPSGADLYVMKRIIHDWDDARAVDVLGCCRDAMAENSRILVIDAVMKPGNEPDPNKDMDLGIMALTPGKERTEAEFRDLLEQAGLRLTSRFATEPPSTLSIIEARRTIDR
jgi:SAM-dependent methyltransferase